MTRTVSKDKTRTLTRTRPSNTISATTTNTITVQHTKTTSPSAFHSRSGTLSVTPSKHSPTKSTSSTRTVDTTVSASVSSARTITLTATGMRTASPSASAEPTSSRSFLSPTESITSDPTASPTKSHSFLSPTSTRTKSREKSPTRTPSFLSPTNTYSIRYKSPTTSLSSGVTLTMTITLDHHTRTPTRSRTFLSPSTSDSVSPTDSSSGSFATRTVTWLHTITTSVSKREVSRSPTTSFKPSRTRTKSKRLPTKTKTKYSTTNSPSVHRVTPTSSPTLFNTMSLTHTKTYKKKQRTKTHTMTRDSTKSERTGTPKKPSLSATRSLTKMITRAHTPMKVKHTQTQTRTPTSRTRSNSLVRTKATRTGSHQRSSTPSATQIVLSGSNNADIYLANPEPDFTAIQITSALVTLVIGVTKDQWKSSVTVSATGSTSGSSSSATSLRHRRRLLASGSDCSLYSDTDSISESHGFSSLSSSITVTAKTSYVASTASSLLTVVFGGVAGYSVWETEKVYFSCAASAFIDSLSSLEPIQVLTLNPAGTSITIRQDSYTAQTPLAWALLLVRAPVTGPITGVVSTLSICRYDDTPPPLLHPTQMSIGSDDEASYRGMLVINMAILLGAAAIHSSVVLIIRIAFQLEMETAMSRLRFPGALYHFVTTLYPGIVLGSYRMAMYASDTASKYVLGPIGILVGTSVIVFFAWRSRSATDNASVVSCKATMTSLVHAINETNARKSRGMPVLKKLHHLFRSRWLWVATQGEQFKISSAVRQHISVVARLREERVVFSWLDLVLVYFLCIIIALHTPSGTECSERAIPVAILLLIYTAAHIKFRPYSWWVHQWGQAVLLSLTTVCAVLVIIQFQIASISLNVELLWAILIAFLEMCLYVFVVVELLGALYDALFRAALRRSGGIGVTSLSAQEDVKGSKKMSKLLKKAMKKKKKGEGEETSEKENAPPPIPAPSASVSNPALEINKKPVVSMRSSDDMPRLKNPFPQDLQETKPLGLRKTAKIATTGGEDTNDEDPIVSPSPPTVRKSANPLGNIAPSTEVEAPDPRQGAYMSNPLNRMEQAQAIEARATADVPKISSVPLKKYANPPAAAAPPKIMPKVMAPTSARKPQDTRSEADKPQSLNPLNRIVKSGDIEERVTMPNVKAPNVKAPRIPTAADRKVPPKVKAPVIKSLRSSKPIDYDDL